MNRSTGLSRRLFLVRGAQAGAGLTLGLSLPMKILAADGVTGATGKNSDTRLDANAFVAITPDNRVIITIKHLEMGQGTYTGLATIVADEMDAAWEQVEAVSAPADKDKYKNLALGVQITGGSNAIRNSWTQMREAGAAARHMLLAAAAEQWQVPVGELSARSGEVIHAASGRRASYGELGTAAATQSVPDEVALKEPGDFTLIGKQQLPRKDTGKVDGSARFTQDVQWRGMLTAVVAHPPTFGGKVERFDAGEARKMPGVKAVLEIPTGVAVLAETFWQAQKAKNALAVEWDNSAGSGLSSGKLYAEYRELTGKPGLEAQSEGDAEAALAEGDSLEAFYEFPYIAHAAMEPMNCVVKKTDGGVQMWYGCQSQTWDQQAVAEVFGIRPEQVEIQTLYAGGSFGRRATLDGNYAREAAEIAKAYGKAVPIKLVWSREDDMTGGYYRPLYVHRVRATLDDQGGIDAWHQRIAGQSIFRAGPDKVDRTTVEGATGMPYTAANLQVEVHNTQELVTPHFWRSVAHTHTAYVAETFIDELAHKAGRDPVEFRLDLLGDHPRHAGVLKLAADKGGWGKSLPDGHFQGIAVHKSFETYVAELAEIARGEDGKFRVVRVTCAVDCGVAVNPDVIRQQMQGGIGFGLSAALFSEVTIENGRPQQDNFDSFQVLRMRHMPAVDVHIVPSAEAPTGVGEPGTPVVAPAVANALFAATGKRFRRLPFGKEVFSI